MHALVVYFEKHKEESVADGFFKFLTNYEKLRQIVFLADLLQIFQHFHKNVQSNSLTIVTHRRTYESSEHCSLNSLKNETVLIGGWEERLNEMVHKTDDGKFLLKGIELTTIDRTRAKKRQFQDVRKDMIETLIKCINERFRIDDELIDFAEPFIKLCSNADDIRNVHKIKFLTYC